MTPSPTLPPDFFDKQKSAAPPATLPPDFFSGAQKPEEKTVGGFLGNVAKSGANLVGNMLTTGYGAIQNPVRHAAQLITGKEIEPTAEEQQFNNIGDVVSGFAHQGFKKVGLGGAVDETPEAQSDIAKAEALENLYKKNYGTWQGFKDKLYNDPAGVAADAAMLTGGISSAAGKTAELADAANATRTASGLRAVSKVAKTATEVNPIVAVPKAIPGAYQAGKSAFGNYVDRVADPHVTMIQALRPTASRVGWDKSIKTAMPDIKAAEISPGAIKDVDSLLDTVVAAKKANRAQFEQFTTPAQRMRMQVDLGPVADAMESSVPETVKFENTDISGNPSGAYKNTLDQAGLYRKKVPIEQAEQFLRDTNAELDSYYAKYPGIKRAQLRANPETAALVAKADALRDALYGSLDEPNLGAGPRELNKRYGAMIDIEDAAFRRKNVNARQAPQNLVEQLGSTHAAGDLVRGGVKLVTGNPAGAVADIAQGAAIRAAAKWAKEHQNTNNLIRRSFKNYDIAPTPVQPPRPPAIRGLLGPANPSATYLNMDLGSPHGDIITPQVPHRLPGRDLRVPAAGSLEEANLRPLTPEHQQYDLDPDTARGLELREDYSSRHAGVSYSDLSPKDQLAVDEMVAHERSSHTRNPYRQ